MRLFFATLGTETNSFSPIPSGWSIWRDTLLRRTRDGTPTAHRGQRTLRPLFDRAAARNWQIQAGLQAFAAPAGPTPAPVADALVDELIADLDAAGRVDAVLLHLHGAMIADGEPDHEGALLARLRAHLPSGVRIGVLLDLHCHLTTRMLDAADLIFGYREYPHVDTFDRLAELFDALADAAEGRTEPVMAMADCAMLGMYPTTTDAMRTLVDRYRQASAADGIIDAWLGHGFPWGDVTDLGARALVIADGDQGLAAAEALRLARETFAVRETIANQPLDLDAALTTALAVDTSSGPVVIADSADNTGGGAPGDSTFFLAALRERRIAHAVIGPLYDPGAVTICTDAGVGAHLELRIGGKLCPESGDPVDAPVEVLGLCDDLVQTLNAAPAHLGPCAAVRVDPEHQGPVVVLASRRIQAGSPELFSTFGIDPETQRLVIVKSSQHFHAGFAALASRVLYCGAPGALSGDVTRIRYRQAPVARLWPFNDEARPGALYP